MRREVVARGGTVRRAAQWVTCQADEAGTRQDHAERMACMIIGVFPKFCKEACSLEAKAYTLFQ